MAKGKGGGAPQQKKGANDERQSKSKKAFKKRPKIFDAIKRRLVTKN
jgi:hypothetical protein